MKQEYYEKIKQYLINNYNQYFIMSKLLNDHEYDFDTGESGIDINILHICFHRDFFSIHIDYSRQIYDFLMNYFNKEELNYIPEMNIINIEFEYTENELKIIYDIMDYIFKTIIKKENKNGIY